MSNGLDLSVLADILVSDGYVAVPAGENSFEVRYQAGFIPGSNNQSREALNVMVTIEAFATSPTGSGLLVF